MIHDVVKIGLRQFRKRIKAEQFFPGRKPWPNGVGSFVRGIWRMDTPEGPRRLDPGDSIITDARGARYPCKADVFKTTYEAVKGD